jgi:hypothetical protein
MASVASRVPCKQGANQMCPISMAPFFGSMRRKLDMPAGRACAS